MRLLGTGLLVVLLLGACRPAPPVREYRLVGQILAVDRPAARVTVRHQDIKGFMPGMTMPFPVRNARLLDGRAPGQLVDATLVVQGTDAWISRLDVVGTAPLPPPSTATMGLGPGEVVSDATFVDQDGQRFTIGALSAPSVITFVYTQCPLPEFCPTIEARLGALQRALRGDAGLHGVRLVAVTIDPAHDTPAVLKAHARSRGLDPAVVTYVTGPPAVIDAFGRQFGLAVTRRGGPDAGIEHNIRTVVLDARRRIVVVLTGADWTVGEALAALRKAAAAS
jgi:protein SCO1/2